MFIRHLRCDSVFPKALEPIRRQLGVADSVLDVPVPEVVLKRPRVVPVIGELEPAGMPGHVGMNGEGQTEWCTLLRNRSDDEVH